MPVGIVLVGLAPSPFVAGAGYLAANTPLGWGLEAWGGAAAVVFFSLSALH